MAWDDHSVLVVGGVTLYSFLVTPIYTAVGRIWIEDELNILPFDEIQTLGGGVTSMQGHIELLLSRTLAAETIEKLELFKNPDYLGKPILKKEAGRSPGSRLPRAADRRFHTEPLHHSRLPDPACQRRFRHRNPELAAEIVNAQVDGYVDMIVRKKSSMSEQARESLNAPIAAPRRDRRGGTQAERISPRPTGKTFLSLRPRRRPSTSSPNSTRL